MNVLYIYVHTDIGFRSLSIWLRDDWKGEGNKSKIITFIDRTVCGKNKFVPGTGTGAGNVLHYSN